jgi:hypothetical protein
MALTPCDNAQHIFHMKGGSCIVFGRPWVSLTGEGHSWCADLDQRGYADALEEIGFEPRRGVMFIATDETAFRTPLGVPCYPFRRRERGDPTAAGVSIPSRAINIALLRSAKDLLPGPHAINISLLTEC